MKWGMNDASFDKDENGADIPGSDVGSAGWHRRQEQSRNAVRTVQQATFSHFELEQLLDRVREAQRTASTEKAIAYLEMEIAILKLKTSR